MSLGKAALVVRSSKSPLNQVRDIVETITNSAEPTTYSAYKTIINYLPGKAFK